MVPPTVRSYVENRWYRTTADLQPVYSAITGEVVAQTSSAGLDFGSLVNYSRRVGGAALRRLTFHERAAMIKALAQAIVQRKEELYEIAVSTGATRIDNAIDIEGGAATLFSYASKGRRELPNERILVDGDPEIVSKGGSFI